MPNDSAKPDMMPRVAYAGLINSTSMIYYFKKLNERIKMSKNNFKMNQLFSDNEMKSCENMIKQSIENVDKLIENYRFEIFCAIWFDCECKNRPTCVGIAFYNGMLVFRRS